MNISIAKRQSKFYAMLVEMRLARLDGVLVAHIMNECKLSRLPMWYKLADAEIVSILKQTTGRWLIIFP